jgi:AcrR family transcriptional regulator
VALRQLLDDGFSRLSLEGVAAEAKVSKPTIYRRWSGKTELVTAALSLLQRSESYEERGSVKEDLVSILEDLLSYLTNGNQMSLVGTVLSEERNTPDLMLRFREQLVAPWKGMLHAALVKGQERGELSKTLDIEGAMSLLLGGLYARHLISAEIPIHYPRMLVEMMLQGIGRG